MIETVQTTTPATRKATANLKSVGLILTSVVFAGSGQLIFKAALNDIGTLTLEFSALIDLATSPLLLLGLAVFGLSALLWLIALMRAELSFAYPFLSLSYVIVLLGGALLFSEQITLPRLLGFGLIITGLVIVARDERQEADT